MNVSLTIDQMQAMIDQSQFHQLFRPLVLAIDHDQLELRIRMSMGSTLERQPGTGQWHGGAVSAIVDIAGCYALALVAREPLPTINFRTDYLRPGMSTDLVATGRVRRAGRTVGVVDVDLVDESQRLVAVGRASYAIQGGLTPR